MENTVPFCKQAKGLVWFDFYIIFFGGILQTVCHETNIKTQHPGWFPIVLQAALLIRQRLKQNNRPKEK